MTRKEAANAEMFHPHNQIFGCGRRVVGEKEKRSSSGNQRIDKLSCAGNQMILAINDSVHIDQITSFHTTNGFLFVVEALSRWAAMPLVDGASDCGGTFRTRAADAEIARVCEKNQCG